MKYRKFRKRANPRRDKKYFSRTARKSHPRNTRGISRGGIRL